ncbi:carboxypeptidase-like regulatory domain-containing protein [Tamlana sp. s12]|uniref:VIT domain-containing protein n=1 Tax=Tamlana sp. s12 TaxID=1630406 RepID=UPI0008380EF7|nr:VIT domain-containing protein [Tamlana sp. s12]QQY82915.1 carboxypeptidase-like regulatory domain-containing protein [Tamlana sp. s12]
MKKLILLFTLVSYSTLFSQETPKVKINDSLQLKLVSLKVDVNVIGNYATTTYDMKFYNELDRTLEGELAFPLGEGQSVSSFAMDLNGKLREAVVVEKELARVAFENTVRQNIDPGLLVKTQGNNYKARIYPILPKNSKHIVITYEQELKSTNSFLVYELPLSISEKLTNFDINIQISKAKNLPIIKNNPYENFFFKKDEDGYTTKLTRKNHTPNKSVIVQIPNTLNNEKIITYNDYFYAYKALNPNSRLKGKPKKITLLWDNSYSLQYRDLEAEIKLLKSYLEYLQDIEVQFISFSNAIHQEKTIKITQGHSEELENIIRNLKYDGGTAYNLFNHLKFKSDEILFFTDGLSNLGAFSDKFKSPIYTINSTISANHEVLNNIATNSGGNYLNLIKQSYTNALHLLKQETYQYLGIKANSSVHEVYPSRPTNVTTDFAISGRFNENTNIELLFGYQGKVTEQIQIPLKESEGSKIIKRLWAKQKIKSLSTNKVQNKKKIIATAKQYHLITDYTSMLILDRIEDYVRYRIEPPQELKREYKQRIKNIEEEKNDPTIKEELFDDYSDILEWYQTKYPLKKKVKKHSSSLTNRNDSIRSVNETSVTPSTAPPLRPNPIIAIDSTRQIVYGNIKDSEGLPLPGVNIIVKGTTHGTTSDFDGNFSINAEINDELVVTYLGFISKTLIIENSNSLDISLEEDSSQLDEVVVVGYGTRNMEALTGSVSGVEISEHRDATGSLNIRGNASIQNTQPLYIVDGIVVSTNPNLSPEEIDNMQVIKGSSATKLYGARAASGLIIITTKSGKEKNKATIETLNNQISDKIELKSWNPNTPYLSILEKEKSVELAYSKYFEIRDQYSNSPAFYLDTSDFFDKKGSPEIAITILTNLIEVKLDNHELMKALAYKLEYYKQYKLAVVVYKKILELRPEEPQSYRDLALAYEQNNEILKSFDLLHKLYSGELKHLDEQDRFYGIEHIAYIELSRLVNKYKNELQLTKEENEKFHQLPVDIRVVIDWNHNDTDIDLWVVDPNNEKAYYKNPETALGGRMSEDLTDGYGPEEFMLKNAIKGNYKVLVDYYADNVQKISGPTILKVTLFKNYADKNEIKKTIIVRLDKEEDEIEIGNIEVTN